MPQYPGNEVDSKCLLKYLNIHSSEEWRITRYVKRFDSFYENVIKQPLSSFTRTMELKCRSLDPIFDDFFNIDYVEYGEKVGLCAFLHNVNNTENDKDISEYSIERFRISIPSSEKEIGARDIMAHELGHLHGAVMALEDKYGFTNIKNLDYRTKNQKMLREFLINYLNSANDNEANVVASFILNKRVIFCKHKAHTVKALNRSYEEIVVALKKLKKV